MKKKIGVITQYYNSTNYGGNLQAYALCSFLNNQGYYAEQICFQLGEKNIKERLSVKSFKEILKTIFRRIINIFIFPFRKIAQKREYHFFQEKKNAFHKFNHHTISHSEEIYSRENIVESVNNYDVFIIARAKILDLDYYEMLKQLEYLFRKQKLIIGGKNE